MVYAYIRTTDTEHARPRNIISLVYVVDKLTSM